MSEVKITESIRLIERQKEIGVAIEQKRSNAVKYGSKRTREAFKRILDEIEELWKEFILNDVALNEAAATESTLLDQPYFKEYKKVAIEEIRQKALTLIKTHFPDLFIEQTTVSNNAEENPDDVAESDDECEQNNAKESNPTNFALLKLTEVLTSQQNFQQLLQQQLQQQMDIIMKKNFTIRKTQATKS